MADLIGQQCVACNVRINWVGDSRFCSSCGSPVHNVCAKTGSAKATAADCRDCGAVGAATAAAPPWQKGKKRQRLTSSKAAKSLTDSPFREQPQLPVRGPAVWWHFGLIGAFVLSFLTVARVIGSAASGGISLNNAGEVAVLVALPVAGFVCGVIVWAGRGLHQRFGPPGDALVGSVVMVVFFVGCMMLFEPAMLGAKFGNGGLPMLTLGGAVGLIGGVLIGRDVRRK